MASSFRIATFNLEDLGSRDSVQPIGAERIDALRPVLTSLKADILCLQEVNAQANAASHEREFSALDQLLDGTPYAAYERLTMSGARGIGPADKHNLVLLSRLPLSVRRQIQHDLLPPISHRPVTAWPRAEHPMQVRFDRPFIYAAVDLPDGRRLHVVNLHLKAPLAAAIAGQKLSALVWKTIAGWAEGFYLASLKRSAQALEARLFIDQLFDAEPDALIAVCGDYNAESHEVPVRLLLGNLDDTGNKDLDSRVLTALDEKLPAARRYSVLHAGRKTMLDHILVSRALLVAYSDAAILNDELPDEAAGSATYIRPSGSYHAPLSADFSLTD